MTDYFGKVFHGSGVKVRELIGLTLGLTTTATST